MPWTKIRQCIHPHLPQTQSQEWWIFSISGTWQEYSECIVLMVFQRRKSIYPLRSSKALWSRVSMFYLPLGYQQLCRQSGGEELPACLACNAAFAMYEGQIPLLLWDSPQRGTGTGMGMEVPPWAPHGHLSWQTAPPGTQPSPCPGGEGTANILWQFYPVAKQLGPETQIQWKQAAPRENGCSGRAVPALDLCLPLPSSLRRMVLWGCARVCPNTRAGVVTCARLWEGALVQAELSPQGAVSPCLLTEGWGNRSSSSRPFSCSHVCTGQH